MTLHQSWIRDSDALRGCATNVHTSQALLHDDCQDESVIYERLLSDCLNALVDLLKLNQVILWGIQAEVPTGVIHVGFVVVPHGGEVEPFALRWILRPIAAVACIGIIGSFARAVVGLRVVLVAGAIGECSCECKAGKYGRACGSFGRAGCGACGRWLCAC